MKSDKKIIEILNDLLAGELTAVDHYVECSIMNSAFGQAWLRLGFVAEAMLVDST